MNRLLLSFFSCANLDLHQVTQKPHRYQPLRLMAQFAKQSQEICSFVSLTTAQNFEKHQILVTHSRNWTWSSVVRTKVYEIGWIVLSWTRPPLIRLHEFRAYKFFLFLELIPGTNLFRVRGSTYGFQITSELKITWYITYVKTRCHFSNPEIVAQYTLIKLFSGKFFCAVQ